MSLTTILYVEDEPFLSRLVIDSLRSSGYRVHWATDGEQAWQAFQAEPPDLCLLDIMLPSRNGYDLARAIRSVSSRMPILFLSAKALSEDVVEGFRSGGNDYLRKPFSMDELLVRVEALLQRTGSPTPDGVATVLSFGPCSLDTVHQKLRTSQGETVLSYKEAALLEMMVRQPNAVVARKAMLLHIWGDDSYYNTRSMDVFMSHLRKLLQGEPGLEIKSLRGVGYKLLIS